MTLLWLCHYKWSMVLAGLDLAGETWLAVGVFTKIQSGGLAYISLLYPVFKDNSQHV